MLSSSPTTVPTLPVSFPGVVDESEPDAQAIAPSTMSSTTDDWKKESAAHFLIDLTAKTGDQTFPTLLPLIQTDLHPQLTPFASVRVGLCISLSPLLSSTTPPLLHQFNKQIIPCIRMALTDSDTIVRHAAAITFDTLFRQAGVSPVQRFVPSLLQLLNSDLTPHESTKKSKK